MQILFVLIIIGLIVWPITRILTRLGYSGWWVLVIFIPFGIIVGLWLLALNNWPRDGRRLEDQNDVFR